MIPSNATAFSQSKVRSPDYNLDRPKGGHPYQAVIIFLVLVFCFFFVVVLLCSGYDGSIRNCCKRKSKKDEGDEGDIDAAERGELGCRLTEQEARQIASELRAEQERKNRPAAVTRPKKSQEHQGLPRSGGEFYEVDLGDRRHKTRRDPKSMTPEERVRAGLAEDNWI
ncbi:hypothetical protein G7Z17_g12435 [Cylindrodendrum hubeiense]|uniref:Uncharacterized protein n=1 Tax=Cylindrodendrum hubeiense TaxID=595255 RepID=A0A9P5GVG4_9HYPO|nr:hypothetical protein G7Z17_g12435 [Cylindrodendrum hubeiense]